MYLRGVFTKGSFDVNKVSVSISLLGKTDMNELNKMINSDIELKVEWIPAIKCRIGRGGFDKMKQTLELVCDPGTDIGGFQEVIAQEEKIDMELIDPKITMTIDGVTGELKVRGGYEV